MWSGVNVLRLMLVRSLKLVLKDLGGENYR